MVEVEMVQERRAVFGHGDAQGDGLGFDPDREVEKRAAGFLALRQPDDRPDLIEIITQAQRYLGRRDPGGRHGLRGQQLAPLAELRPGG